MASDDEQAGDIEKQLLHEISQNSSTEPADLVVVDDNNNDDDKATTGVDESAVPRRINNIPVSDPEAAKVKPSFASKMASIVLSVLKHTGWLIFMIALYPYLLADLMVSAFEKDPEKSKDDEKLPGAKPKGIYIQMFEVRSTKDKITDFNADNTTRLGCVALLWLVLTLCIPRLNSVMLFGGLLWKWSLLLVVILLAYPAMLAVIFGLNVYLEDVTGSEKIDYWGDELTNSSTSLLYFGFILLMWLLYFRTDKGLHPYQRVEDFATWTFVSLLVGAFLWVTKSAALVKWKGSAVYLRFKDRILTAGFKLFFLAQIIIGRRVKELTPWMDDFDLTKAIKDGPENLRIQDYWLSKPFPTYRMAKVAMPLTDLARVTLRDNDGIPEIVAKCQQIATHKEEDQSTTQYITMEVLKEKFRLNKEEAWILFQVLKGEQMSEEITYDAFQKWMVDAHKNCQSVGFTLIDALEVISILNKVLIGAIVAFVILLWLLLTGLGTTNVLVLVASPLVALSFVFGDTCKTFFQGIIFSFVRHPFDIGDRCVIDGIELEVKRIGILMTTFIKIGTKEEVMHPNTSLATMVITNFKGEPDPRDMIELTLDSSTSMSNILSFKADLESFFESIDQRRSYEKNIRVAVKEIGSSIKVGISFTHVMNVQDVSHSQCLLKKNNQRYELLVKIKQILEDKEIQLAT